MNKIKIGNKSTEQKSTLKNFEKFYNARSLVINFFDDYSLMVSEAETTKGRILRILTPNQVLQRLPIAFVQVKASKASENLLNEIHQLKYSL